RYGARLILRPPLDPGRDVELEITFRAVDAAAPAQLLVVSLLGFHAALTGPGLPVEAPRSRFLIGTGDLGSFLEAARRGQAEAPRSRFLIGTGDLGSFLEEVRRGKGEERNRLLKPGDPQTLRLAVNARRGVVRLFLDGELCAERSFPGRAPEPLSAVLRSLDP